MYSVECTPEEDPNAPSLRFDPPEKLLDDEAPGDGVILPPGWKFSEDLNKELKVEITNW